MADLRTTLTRFLALPPDVVMDLPKLTLLGDVQLLVENHQGIISFSEGRIVIQTAKGHLTIEGDTLMVGAVDRESIVVTGRILAVQWGSKT